MAKKSGFFFVTSLSGFKSQVYQDFYVSMTRVLNTTFEVVADRLFLVHVPLVVKGTQCLLSHMYLYFLDPKNRKSYVHISDYYLRKHLCEMKRINADLPQYVLDQQLNLRFQHYATRLECVFRALLPDMLMSLCRIESYPPKDADKCSRARLREIFILFQ